MALERVVSGGYSYDFLDAPPSELECPVCLLVMREPHLTSCCGNHFCFTCINEVREKGKPCPLCKMDVTHTLLNRKERNRTRDLKVYCELRSSGCEWTGPLANIEAHLSVGQEVGPCQFVQVKCPLGCGREVGRKELGNHVEEDCPCRLQKCPYCEVKATGQNLVDHFSVCNKFPTVCPNSCELKSFPRCELSDHLESCPFQPVSCTFERVGCHLELKRKELKDHLDTCIQNHMEMLVEKMDLVEKRNSVLEEQLLVSEKKIVLLEERLDQYEAANVASVSRENDLKENERKHTEEPIEVLGQGHEEERRPHSWGRNLAQYFGWKRSIPRARKRISAGGSSLMPSSFAQNISDYEEEDDGADGRNDGADGRNDGADGRNDRAVGSVLHLSGKRRMPSRIEQLYPLVIAAKDGHIPSLQLKEGDIVNETVDAIVCPVDPYLFHDGGCAGAINRASNGYLQTMSSAYIRKKKKLNTSETVAFGAEGNLSCNYVICVVGPDARRYGAEAATTLLKEACENVLKEALQLKISALAIPSISAGAYSMDTKVVAQVLIDACLSYQYPKDCPLKEIRLTIFDGFAFMAFKKYFLKKKKELEWISV